MHGIFLDMLLLLLCDYGCCPNRGKITATMINTTNARCRMLQKIAKTTSNDVQLR